jgi:hypothetical protein
MKHYLSLIALLVIVAGCDVYVVEPRYDPRNAVIGLYDVEEYSETYSEYVYYTIEITKSSYSDKVYIGNFYDSNIRAEAFIDHNKIIIPYQLVNGYEIEGVGTLSANFVSFRYSVKDTYSDSYTDFCEADAFRY